MDTTLFNYKISLPNSQIATLRPLKNSDVDALVTFLENLSATTRTFWKLDSYDINAAKKMCEDISKYDKLRFVAEINEKIIGLFEFSMDIPENNLKRFHNYGIELQQGKDCRFGPCISDELQGRGFGTAIFPYILQITKQLDQDRIILWGGVLKENERAIRYYVKNGFEKVGEFIDKYDDTCIDMILVINK